MKAKLTLLGLVLGIVGLVLTQILNSGAEHIKVVDAAVSLEEDNKKLVKENKKLESSVSELEKAVTATEESDNNTPVLVPVEIIKNVKVIVHDTIVIHDTVYIKEQKNFWGKTKTDTLQ